VLSVSHMSMGANRLVGFPRADVLSRSLTVLHEMLYQSVMFDMT